MKVRFCSPVQSHSGYAQIGRILVNQLVQAGIDVSVLEIPQKAVEADFGPLGDQLVRLTGVATTADVNIINMVPPMFDRFRLEGARNIGCSTFEADQLPAEWVQACNRMDAMWVPSEWSRRLFIESGVLVPVSVVGVDAAPTPVSIPEGGPFRLLSIFQWSARKNPLALLRAYCAAFDGNPDTVLTLKVHRQADPKQNQVFVQNAVNYILARIKPRVAIPRIEVATNTFSAGEMEQLHAASHAYVSLSHGEGWGLPAWQATLAGKPVIHTGWSSPTEFMHEQGLVKYNMSPLYGMDESVPFYDIGMRWAEPHLDDAITRLRDLHANYATWLRNSRAHRNVINNRYSLERRLEQISKAV